MSNVDHSTGHRAISSESIIKQLNWRYATKKFDPAKKISPVDLATLEQAMILSSSSFGLQPWKFVVVSDPAIRLKLRAAAFNQAQITDASQLVVFCFRKTMTPDDVQQYIDRIAEVRNVPAEKLEEFKQMMVGFVKSKAPADMDTWSARQVYIALGFLLTTAAMLGIDACPMEGFDPAKFNEILDLPKAGYSSVALCAIGYRAEDDHAAKLTKVRHTAGKVIDRR